MINRRTFTALLFSAVAHATTTPKAPHITEALFIDYSILDCSVPTRLRDAYLLRSDGVCSVDMELHDTYWWSTLRAFKAAFLASQTELIPVDLHDFRKLVEEQRKEVGGHYVTIDWG